MQNFGAMLFEQTFKEPFVRQVVQGFELRFAGILWNRAAAVVQVQRPKFVLVGNNGGKLGLIVFLVVMFLLEGLPDR